MNKGKIWWGRFFRKVGHYTQVAASPVALVCLWQMVFGGVWLLTGAAVMILMASGGSFFALGETIG